MRPSSLSALILTTTALNIILPTPIPPAHAWCDLPTRSVPCVCASPLTDLDPSSSTIGTITNIETTEETTYVTLDQHPRLRRDPPIQNIVHVPIATNYPCDLDPPAFTSQERVFAFILGPVLHTTRDLCADSCPDDPRCPEDCSQPFIITERTIDPTQNTLLIYPFLTEQEIYFGTSPQGVDYIQDPFNVRWQDAQACAYSFPPSPEYQAPPCNDVIDTSTCTIHPSSPNSPPPLHTLVLCITLGALLRKHLKSNPNRPHAKKRT